MTNQMQIALHSMLLRRFCRRFAPLRSLQISVRPANGRLPPRAAASGFRQSPCTTAQRSCSPFAPDSRKQQTETFCSWLSPSAINRPHVCLYPCRHVERYGSFVAPKLLSWGYSKDPLHRHAPRVHSQMLPESCTLRPVLATAQVRSALAVPPGFDGFLRATLRRFIAPCNQSWGSPRFSSPACADSRLRRPDPLPGTPCSYTPSRAFPSLSAMNYEPCHHGPCPLAVHRPRREASAVRPQGLAPTANPLSGFGGWLPPGQTRCSPGLESPSGLGRA